MLTTLTPRMPTRMTALLAIAVLMAAALTAGLAYSLSARSPVAANGVIHGNGNLADNGVLHGWGILADDGVIHGYGVSA
jgi:hypothetical protein